MKPESFQLDIFQGFQLQYTFQLLDGDDVAVDLTGSTLYAEVREDRDGAVILDLSPAIWDATEGKLAIDVADETTDALTAGIYRWDLMIDFGDGKRLGPYIFGPAIVREGITQP